MNAQLLSHGIQLAVAPVFLLTAIAAMLGVVAGRLARIIDRARVLEQRLDQQPLHEDIAIASELNVLARRGHLVNIALAMLTVSAMLIALTIVALFIAEVSTLRANLLVTGGFLTGLCCFVLALLCFLIETQLATHTLKFRRKRRSTAVPS
jgi:hypothetical protein